MSVEIRRASDAFVEKGPGRQTRHGLSFGAAYDADNLRFGPMVCHDDHLLGRERGFEPHRHADLVIVSWVLTGALDHTHSNDGSSGVSRRVDAGSAAVLHTGSGDGVEHSEVAAEPQTRFVQVWLTPPADDPAAPDASSYDVVTPALEPGVLTPVCEPVPGAAFSVARLAAGDVLTLPAAPRVHVFVGRGALIRSSLAEPLADGDAFRFVDEPAYDVTAAVPTELLIWTFTE